MQPAAATFVSAPEMPQHVYVGAVDGELLAADSTTYEIWPKFVVNLYLQGGHSFSIDGVRFEADAGHGATCRAQALMINVRRYAKLRYGDDDYGAPLRKVMTSAPLTWLEREMRAGTDGSPVLDRFFSGHLSHYAFQPSPDLIEIGEQICRPPSHLKGELLTLYRKARGMEMMRLACAALVSAVEGIDHKPSMMSAQKCERLKGYILANLSKDLTIETIAQDIGASPSSIQRHFKLHCGMTVFEFIRRKRLEAARDALEHRGVTVVQAAWIAGYAHASSFVTAFKRAFGTCPGDVRA